VTDGTSSTVAFGEVMVGGPDNTASSTNNGRNGITGMTLNTAALVIDASRNVAAVNQALQVCSQNYNQGGGSGQITQNVGQRWGWGDVGMSMFTTIVPPNSSQHKWNACRNGCGGCSPDSSSFTNATSNHSGGCNIGFGDGSVRFIKSSIAQTIWMAIGTKSNGEVVSSDAY